jgi:hypothetical protein
VPAEAPAPSDINLPLKFSVQHNFANQLDPLHKSVFDDETPVAALKHGEDLVKMLVSSTSHSGLHVVQVLLSTRPASGGCTK